MNAEDDHWFRQRRLLGEGHEKLRNSRVLVVGCGGLGAGAIPALTAAGIGHLTLLDDDHVVTSNLNRQTLFTTEDVGRSKVKLATARMRALSPDSEIEGRHYRLTADDVDLVAAHDLVVDCTDRQASRAAISAACRAAGRPWVWAGIDGWTAVVSVFVPGGPQWEDVVGVREELPAPPQILGATPTLAGAWEAAEAVKVLTGLGEPLIGRLAVIDLLSGTVRFVDLV